MTEKVENTTRILFVLHEKKLGGASKSVVALMGELLAFGYEIHVITPFGRGPVYDAVREMKIPIKQVFFGWWMMPSYWPFPFKMAFRFLYKCNPVAINRICRYAQKNDIQIIHSNSSVIDTGARAAKKLGIPHVWHFREYGDIDFSLEYLLGRNKSCGFVNAVKGKCIFISGDLYNYYREDIMPERSRVIYNGVSENYIQYKEIDRLNMERVTFLVSGTLHKTKRQDIALHACRILCDRKRDFKLIVAGSSSALQESRQYEKELRDYAAENLGDHVEFTGYTTKMNELRARSDVELVCSTREAFGRVTVEAMLSGNPVIGADSGANPELISDGVTGFLFKPEDAAELADKMEAFIINPEHIREYGQRARETAEKRFMARDNAANIAGLYSELLSVERM